MKDRCDQYWEGIVDLAEGREASAALQHVEHCEECSRKLGQLRTMMSAGKARYFDAPVAVVDAVKDMMPQAERRVLRLLRTTTAWSGARTVAEDFQIVAGDGVNQFRLMYSHTGDGWEVLGRAPSGDWSVAGLEAIVEVDDDGRFTFRAADLGKTGFFLIGPDIELVVPSAEEMLSSGSDGGH